MRWPARNLLFVLVLALSRQAEAANGPVLMPGDPCPPPFNGTVRPHSVECNYDVDGADVVGTVVGVVNQHFPPPGSRNMLPGTSLSCTITCARTASFIAGLCILNPNLDYLQGCPAKVNASDVLQRQFPGHYNPFGGAAYAAQQCEEQLGDLDEFCEENENAAGGLPANVMGGPGGLCCEPGGGFGVPQPTGSTDLPMPILKTLPK